MSDIEKYGDGDPHIAEFELCHNPEEVLRIGRDFQGQDTFCGAQHDTVKLLCDTIEYLRDRLSKQFGNAAAMREALEHIGVIAEAMYSDSGDCNSVNANTVSILNLVRAALSAPPRNCDVEYADQVEMYYAFKEWCKAKGHTMEPMLAYDAFDWLLAQRRSGEELTHDRKEKQ